MVGKLIFSNIQQTLINKFTGVHQNHFVIGSLAMRVTPGCLP
jgi:hypothetical protein